MKFCHLSISLTNSPENTAGDENKIRWIIEVNDLYKQHSKKFQSVSCFSKCGHHMYILYWYSVPSWLMIL